MSQVRIPTQLFDKKGHYLGRPANFDDKIIQRRINLVEQIPNFTNKKYDLLEIGCGNGASMFLLADKMKSCVGVEIEDTHYPVFKKLKKQFNNKNCFFQRLNIEKERLNRQFDRLNCFFQRLNIEKERLNRQFDRLISFEVIEHLEDDKNVKYYYDVLKKGGIAAFSVPNKWWIFETHGAKLPPLPWNRVPFFSWLPRA